MIFTTTTVRACGNFTKYNLQTYTTNNLEFRHPNKTIPVEVLSPPIFDESGKVIYALTVCIDIPERKKAEKIRLY
jgi:PAS domain S-box-containing protein